MFSEVAGLRGDEGWFAPRDVTALFEQARIEPPNVSAYLARLRADRLVVRRSDGRYWSLTPEGREAVRERIGGLDYRRLQAELGHSDGADFLRALNPVIDPAFAPPRWAPGIARLHARFPFETNVFCMTRFPRPGEESLPDPIGPAVEALRGAMADHGLMLHVAWDRQVEDDLFGNVGAYMWGSQYGIGLLEDRVGRGLNYNVVVELGSMLITGRRCCMLRDPSAPEMPSDLGAELTKPVDLGDSEAVGRQAHRWVAEDLGKGPCAHCAE